MKGSYKDVTQGSCITLFSAEWDNPPRGSGFKLKLGKLRWHSRKSYFTWAMKVRRLSVIQMGLSCAVVELEASSTGKGLVRSAPGLNLAPGQKKGVKLFSSK